MRWICGSRALSESYACLLPAIRDSETPRYIPIPGGYSHEAAGLDIATKDRITQTADFSSQANARNAVASSPHSLTPSNPSVPTKSSHLRFSQTPKAWPFSLSSRLVSWEVVASVVVSLSQDWPTDLGRRPLPSAPLEVVSVDRSASNSQTLSSSSTMPAL